MNACREGVSAKFSTYAYYYVLGDVTKYIRENKLVKVSRDMIRLNQSIEKAREILRQKLFREATDSEVALFLDISLEQIVMARDATILINSLDGGDDLSTTDYYNLIGVFEQNMDSRIMDLKDAISGLSLEEQKIICDRYFMGYTQTEVSSDLGISQVQVSRKESKILEKLKVRL